MDGEGGDKRGNRSEIEGRTETESTKPLPWFLLRLCVDVAWKWYWDLELGLESKLSRLSRHVVETNKAGKLAKCV